MVESLSSKLLGLKDGDFIKKWLQRRCFPVKFTKFLRTHILKNGCCYVFYLLWHHHLPAIEKKVQPSVLLKNMLVYRHPAGSTGNWRVKIFFWHIFLKKNFFCHKYISLAMLTLQSKINFLFFLLLHFLIGRIVLSFLTHCPPQVSLDCTSLDRQINRWKASTAAIRNANDLQNFQMWIAF